MSVEVFEEYQLSDLDKRTNSPKEHLIKKISPFGLSLAGGAILLISYLERPVMNLELNNSLFVVGLMSLIGGLLLYLNNQEQENLQIQKAENPHRDEIKEVAVFQDNILKI